MDSQLQQRLAELEKTDAVLTERIKTMQAEYLTALADLKADMAKRDVDMAKRDADMAKRDRDNTRWQIGLWASATIIIIAALGFFMNILIRTGSVPGT